MKMSRSTDPKYNIYYKHCSFTYLTHLVHDGRAVLLARDRICRARYYAIARPPVRPSVTRVDQSKTVGEDNAIFTA